VIGLTDGIEVDYGLASPLLDTWLELGTARQGQFDSGDRVRHFPSGLTGRATFTDDGALQWIGDDGTYYTSWVGHIAHVEPAASVEATASGEAKPRIAPEIDLESRC
jgi:hypothetical protein